VLDRTLRAQSGALALRHLGTGWEITPARPAGYDRPWAPRRGVDAPMPAASSEAPSAASKPAAPAAKRDATPRAEDLEPGD
jgi:hypothetical protein